MMARFCGYLEKVFHLGKQMQPLRDSRPRPVIPTQAVFASVLTMFATARPSLNQLEKEIRVPARLRGIVGRRLPSVDSIGRIYAQLAPQYLQQMLSASNHQVRRRKMLHLGDWKIAAVDGHEFFSSRKRCCPQCQTRTVKVQGEEVTEYYHQGVVCHLIDEDLALPLDVELLRPGEGEETAAKRLLERVFQNYSRSVDIVVGDALYFDAPFINFCREHHKHAIVVIKGDHRLLLQDAHGVFAQQAPCEWHEPHRLVRCWDQEGFTSAEGVREPLRVLHTEETVYRRERIAGKWQPSVERCQWYWAVTLSKNQLNSRAVYRAGHHRWDVENDCFNTLSTHWALNHCFKHAPWAIVNFILTCFIAFVLLQCFWLRNLKPPARHRVGTLIGLASELYRSLGGDCRALWQARPP